MRFSQRLGRREEPANSPHPAQLIAARLCATQPKAKRLATTRPVDVAVKIGQSLAAELAGRPKPGIFRRRHEEKRRNVEQRATAPRLRAAMCWVRGLGRCR